MPPLGPRTNTGSKHCRKASRTWMRRRSAPAREGVGSPLLEIQPGGLDSIVIRAHLGNVDSSKRMTDGEQYLEAPPPPTRRLRRIGPYRVRGDYGAAWKDTYRKSWACGGTHPLTQDEYATKERNSQVVTIDGCQWRLVLSQEGVEWESMDDAEGPYTQRQAGPSRWVQTAEAPACPLVQGDAEGGGVDFENR